MKLLLLNGPPYSGKDTIGTEIAKTFAHNEGVPYSSVYIEKFAQPIRNAVVATFPHITHENLDSLKSKPLYPYGTLTLRQWMINYSEDLMKPSLGKDIFGKLLASRCREINVENPNALVIITDCGFHDEVVALQECIQMEFLKLVQLHREGCTFDGDSRGWVYLGPEDTHKVDNSTRTPIQTAEYILHHILG